MTSRQICITFGFWGCFFALSGCIYNDEPMPRITQDYMAEGKVVQLPIRTLPKIPVRVNENVPVSWFSPSWVEKRWTAIVIHHSGTENGSSSIFDKWHRLGRHWQGVGYDFVIGNGTDSGDGQVEVTFRWQQQTTGAHCGGTADNWANRDAVGICLVGDFDRTVPTGRQMQSLVKLVRFLQSRYGIPKSRIYGHRNVPGARETDCPGKNFNMANFKSML